LNGAEGKGGVMGEYEEASQNGTQEFCRRYVERAHEALRNIDRVIASVE